MPTDIAASARLNTGWKEKILTTDPWHPLGPVETEQREVEHIHYLAV